MYKGRHCYCDRLYPGFQCGYCRLSAYLEDREQPDPRLASAEPAPVEGSVDGPSGWWARVSAYGKSVLRGSEKKQPS
jgi:hypothetical protein